MIFWLPEMKYTHFVCEGLLTKYYKIQVKAIKKFFIQSTFSKILLYTYVFFVGKALLESKAKQ